MSRIPQSKEALLKSYNTRLKEDVKSMLENFEGILCFITSKCKLLYLCSLHFKLL